tara:strand:+ start:1660 stop:2286 length:627 start_codon:yes stop_codon:yes gene_type:complete
MEAVAMLGGEDHTADPGCACQVLAAFGRRLNDEMGIGAQGDVLRAKYLSDLAPRLVGTRSTPEVELRRALVFADGAVRVLAPLAMEAAGRVAAADALRALSPVIDRDTADRAAAAARAAYAAVNAADAAAANAAYSAANAAAAYAAAAADYSSAHAAGHAAVHADYAATATAAAGGATATAGGADGARAWAESRALFIRAMEVSDEVS